MKGDGGCAPDGLWLGSEINKSNIYSEQLALNFQSVLEWGPCASLIAIGDWKQ